MDGVTRRAALAGIAAGGAALAGSLGVRAAAPQANQQAPGFYRHRVGDFQITPLVEGTQSVPLLPEFVRNAGIEEVKSALAQDYAPPNQVPIAYNPVVVNTGSKLVLIDTGFGPDRPVGIERASPAGVAGDKGTSTGLLQKNLAAAGIEAKSIDVVLISHFHADHINGLRTADGALAFPNAEIIVSATESKFWTDESNLNRGRNSGSLGDNFRNVRRVLDAIGKQVTLHDGRREVVPGITTVPTPGHTPGHTSFAINSGTSLLLVQSDITIQRIFLRNPNWIALTDVDPDQAIASRRKFYDFAVAEKALIAGYHFPFPGLCHIEKGGNGYDFVPIAWNPTL